MLRLLMCLFGLHSVTEFDHTIDGDEIKLCRECLINQELAERIIAHKKTIIF